MYAARVPHASFLSPAASSSRASWSCSAKLLPPADPTSAIWSAICSAAPLMCTVNDSEAAWSAASVAVHVTKVSPIANVEPDAVEHTVGSGRPNASVALEAYVTTAPPGCVAFATIGAGTVTDGGRDVTRYATVPCAGTFATVSGSAIAVTCFDHRSLA